MVRLKDLQKTGNNFYLIFDYCNGGDLDNLKEQRGHFSEEEARMILFSIVQGFKAIYDMQVMHRDLKLANILVHFPDLEIGPAGIVPSQIMAFNQKLKEIDLLKTKVEIKIADLGFAKEVNIGDLT